MPSPEELVKKYERMLADRPGNELLLFSLGKALIDAGRPQEAKPHLEEGLALKPDWMVVRMLLGRIEREGNNEPAAINHYQAALALAIEQHHEDPEAECRAILKELGALS